MRGTWVLALAAGATLAVAAPSAAEAQSGTIRERWEQAARRTEHDDDRDRDRAREREREREHERARAEERERERLRAREQELERERMRARERELERIRARERDRERIRARERELERIRDRERLRNRGDRDRDSRDWDNDDWDDDDRRRSRNGRGPAFCRNGAGHPVHGRDWCRRKGYELGSDRWERWDRDRWGNIVFHDAHRRRRDERLSRSGLAGLLGNSLLNRFESHGRRQYGSGPMIGYWLPESGANVLQLNVGSEPYARLIDVNRDGRVDNLLVRR